MKKRSSDNMNLKERIYDAVRRIRTDVSGRAEYNLNEFDGLRMNGKEIEIFDPEGRLIGLVSWIGGPRSVDRTRCIYTPLKDSGTRPVYRNQASTDVVSYSRTRSSVRFSPRLRKEDREAASRCSSHRYTGPD